MDNIRCIVHHYGKDVITLITCEELAELIQAVTKHNRIRNSATKDNLIEELADAKIVMQEIQVMYGIGDEIINEVMEEKIERQLRRMEGKEE